MTKRLDTAALAWGLEKKSNISYEGKYVKFKNNSGIFRIHKVQASTVMPDDRPHLDLRFNFFCNEIRNKDKELRLQVSVTLDTGLIEKSNIDVLDFIHGHLTQFVEIIKDSSAIEVLYGEKGQKVAIPFNGEAYFYNGRHPSNKY